MIKDQEFQLVMDEKGQLQALARLTPDQQETLKALESSGAWKLYRKILLQAKDGYFQSALPMKDPNEILKTIGIVAGINFAVNQLAFLVAQYNKQAKTVEGETKNHPQAQG